MGHVMHERLITILGEGQISKPNYLQGTLDNRILKFHIFQGNLLLRLRMLIQICTCIELGFCESLRQIVMFIDELTIEHEGAADIIMP